MRRFVRKDSANVRPSAVAGRFYPGNPVRLRAMVENFLGEANAPAGSAPKAIIAPHAGYVYSGPIAASAYARLAPAREIIKRVVLLGPSHFVSFDGLAAPGAEAFATPLGTVPVDTAVVRDLCSHLPQVSVRDDAHADEHALEVQLPFLQVVLADFKIMPLLVGEARDEEVAEVIESLWDGVETCIVISSDLSHYHDYETAQRTDSGTARAIESLNWKAVGVEQACGRMPICGLLSAAKERGLRCRAVDLRNSGDTSGERERVVGYGAFVFTEN
ncbi:MAG: AmmeMemoRadiSam system protein B [Verrucomicrobiota bacterium]|jgi:AmmeMemoRadiSam system protein B